MSRKQGAIKPWQTETFKECQDDLLAFAQKRGIPMDTAWQDLTEAQRTAVIEGEGQWPKKVWYGVRRFFAWLESKAYKMHIRVLLSKYRAYTPCLTCGGARLKLESLLWRLGDSGDCNTVLDSDQRFRPPGWSGIPEPRQIYPA